jgi:hypothetical protein
MIEEWRYSSTILDLGTRWRWEAILTPLPIYPPGKDPPVPIGQEAGWVPEPVWALWRGAKSLSAARNRTMAVKPVA